MTYAPLHDRAVLEISGDDAKDFLQGLITKDMRKVTSSTPVFAALLSPQGRFLFDFFIVEQNGHYLLETDKARLPDLIKRLTLYRLRSKVQFTTRDNLRVAALWNENTVAQAQGVTIYTDPRLPELGWRMMMESPAALSDMTSGDYEAHRLSLGVPEGAKDLIYDRSILLEYGYDELHGVDFDKGCYVGQEVTARSKHRAALRKFIHIIKADMSLPPADTAITANGREAGVIGSIQEYSGLAYMKVEEVERARRENMPLMAGNVEIKAILPFWCKTAFA